MDRRWHVLDAGGRPLGRIASEAARLLLGKHKPSYEPHLAMGDYVVVINASRVAITGNKAQQKVYYRHSGYPGNLRERRFEEQMERDPRKVIERAIRGMLPHTRLGRELFRHLRVYAGSDHPHEAQLRAGSGIRARRRVAALPPPVVESEKSMEDGASVSVEAVNGDRLTGSLNRYRRAELDLEAERLGIEIQSGWRKAEVVEAISVHYDENPIIEDAE
jgi:large subunit ribosomal protein L13